MSRIEYINISGLRVDGRRGEEIRRFRARMGLFPRADGSAMVEMGNTKVFAVVHGPREATRHAAGEHEGAILRCDYSVAPFAGIDRRKRKATDRKIVEVSTAILECLTTVVEMKLYPHSQIDIHIQVVQSDGAAICAAINAATLALIDAGVAMKEFVVACSAAYIQRTALLDPNHVEGTSGGPELTLAMLPQTDKVTLTTMDARLPLEALELMMECAMKGCKQIYELMRATVLEHTSKKFQTRSLGAS